MYADTDGLTTIIKSTFSNNSAGGAGGAIGNVAAVTVTNSTFNHNVANGAGGAINQDVAGDIVISGSTFTKNASLTDVGGAINGDSFNFEVRITNSKFTYNTSEEQGGAIGNNGAKFVINGSTFDHNTSVTDNGGAIDDAIVTATNSSFTNNTAKSDGGAIDPENNDISLTACTFSGNSATNGEGGAFNDGFLSAVSVQLHC